MQKVLVLLLNINVDGIILTLIFHSEALFFFYSVFQEDSGDGNKKRK